MIVAVLVSGLSPIISSGTTVASPASGRGSSQSAAPAQQESSFPAPPPGAAVFAQEAGLDALALAVTPSKHRVGLQASVVGQQGSGVSHLPVRFEVAGPTGTTTAVAAPCGRGCYRATAAVARPAHVTVVIGGRHPRRALFALPTAWPPRPAGRLLTRVARTWRALHSLVDHDLLSDGHVTGMTVWKMVAPDKLEYSIDVGGRSASVIIGDRRWDKVGRSPWKESSQVPVHQPSPDWGGAVDIHLLGTVSDRGRPAWRISFYDPSSQAWFTIVVDKATLHTEDVYMTATAHFMHDSYGSFNTPIRIVPPT